MADPGARGGLGPRPTRGRGPAGQRVTADPLRDRRRGLPGAVAHPERGAGRHPAAVPVRARAWPGTSSPSPSRTAGTTTSPWATWAGSTVPTSPSAVGASGCSGTTSARCRSVRGWICGASAPWRRTRACPAAVGRPARAVPTRLRRRRPAGSQGPGAARPAGPQPTPADPAAGRCRSRRPPRTPPCSTGSSAPPSRRWRRTRATTSSTERSSRPTFGGRPPRRGPRPGWGCPSAPTDGTSARASPGSWPGAGNARSTVPTEAHHRIRA